LISCGQEKNDFGRVSAHQDRVVEISPEERARLLPNALFVAVWNDSADQASRLVAENPSLLQNSNAEGDTPLGMALSRGFSDVTRPLLKATTVDSLFHANVAGESYVFLAARSGFTEAIRGLVDLYYDSLGGFERYRFAKLDFPNALGQRALFAAADRQVVEALEAQYYRGALNYPYRSFTLLLDKKGDTFLHAAAREGRSDVILWAAEKICRRGDWQNSEHVWLRAPSRFFSRLLREAETYTYVGDLNLPTPALFNRQNVEGRTPLHEAATHRQWDALRALADCPWLDYDLPDSAGDIPLQSLLAALNPYLASIDAPTKDAFGFLLAQNTQSRRWNLSEVDRVNWADNKGNNSLHLAARLADPYFYNVLAAVGDTKAPNKDGALPESLFRSRQERVRNHAD
jgi:ankyrin repeat protein